MSYQNPNIPTQYTKSKFVYGDESNDDHDNIGNIAKRLESQHQSDIGKIPHGITRIPPDLLIQETRYNVHTPTYNYTSNDNRNDNYDIYIDDLERRGLLKENYKTRVVTNYIHIDSNARTTTTELTKENIIYLTTNPLTFTKLTTTPNTYLLTIYSPNHTFKANDKITLSGMEQTRVSFNTIYTYTSQTDDVLRNGFSVIFEPDVNVLAFKCSLLKSTYWDSGNYVSEYSTDLTSFSFDPNFIAAISQDELNNYDTTDMYVTISGFTANSFIGNISTQFLNATHRVYLSFLTNPYINDMTESNPSIKNKVTGFYILLPKKFVPDDAINPPITTNMTITVDFLYIGGIPINQINAEIPVTNNNIKGLLNVYSVTENTINIKILNKTYYDDIDSELPISFGGDNINITKVTNINTVYDSPNSYVIELPESIHKVFMAKLVNTNFPNINLVFQTNINNKIYWQNQYDGDYVYSTQITEGNYSITALKNILETQMSSVQRISPIIIDGSYTNNLYFETSIEETTNITTFKSSKEASLNKPIFAIYDSSSPTPQQLTSSSNINTLVPAYTLIIEHQGHQLQATDEQGNDIVIDILFEGFIATLGISATDLNTTHTVYEIIDDNFYSIQINNINLSAPLNDTQGGYGTFIYVPNYFRLLFNYSDTMGTELGFRYVGRTLSFTNYGTEITNQDPYQDEDVTVDPSTSLQYVTDEIGKRHLLKNNALKLHGHR